MLAVTNILQPVIVLLFLSVRELIRPYGSFPGSRSQSILGPSDEQWQVYTGDRCGVNILLWHQEIQNKHFPAIFSAFFKRNEPILWDHIVLSGFPQPGG